MIVDQAGFLVFHFIFIFSGLFFFDLQACDRSLVGSVAGKQKMRTATATGYRLQAAGSRGSVLFFLVCGLLWLSFGAFVVVIWEVFRMSLI